MSIQDRINVLVNNEATAEQWESHSQVFLTATGQTGKNLEAETLYNIIEGAHADSSVIRTVAEKYKRDNWDPQDTERKIKLFLLHHRSGFSTTNVDGTGSMQPCYTFSQSFIDCASNSAPDAPNLGPVVDPSATNQGYENIAISGDPVYHVVEQNKLFGKIKPLGFYYSFCTGACIFNGETGEIQDYPGFFYEGIGEIPPVTGAGKTQNLQFFIYTAGGGPLTPTNWIIKVVEAQTSVVSDEMPAYAQPYTFTASTGAPRIVTKTYIHMLKPGGSYVRRYIDRTNNTPSGALPQIGTDLSTWYYQDYANGIATLAGDSFKTVWNECYSGNHRILGKPDPNKYDFSLCWNHGLIDGFANGKAIHGSDPVWTGKEVL